jgi:hypothetical protein
MNQVLVGCQRAGRGRTDMYIGGGIITLLLVIVLLAILL